MGGEAQASDRGALPPWPPVATALDATHEQNGGCPNKQQFRRHTWLRVLFSSVDRISNKT